MRIRLIITACALFLCTFISTIAVSYDYMKLCHKSGAEILLALDQKPRIKFQDNFVSVGTNRYEIAELDKYTFIDSSNVENIINDEDIYLDANGHLHLRGGLMGTVIYDVNGRQVNFEIIEISDGWILDLSKLATGVYFVTIGQTTFKIFFK